MARSADRPAPVGVELRLLGAFEIVVDDAGQPVLGRGERALVALLALSAGHVVPASSLIAQLWSTAGLPDDPVHALQIRVSKLRRALGDAGVGRLVLHDGVGYRLDAEPAVVDAHVFRSLIEAARRTGDPDRAVGCYDRALAAVVSDQPGRCPECGMKLLPAGLAPPAAPHADNGDPAGHAQTDGIEWEDDMVEVNKMTTPQNMRWILRDRASGAENGAINWRFRVGDQVKIRLANEMDSDHPMHHPFHVHGAGRFLILSRNGVADENLVWKDTVLVRTGEVVDILLDITNPGDGTLPRRRTPRKRHDVQLPRRPRIRGAPMTTSADQVLDVLVIGGGQAGLALGHQLRERGQRRFLIVDAGAETGAAWRGRWDSLVLFTPAQYDNLPGLRFPAAANTYPSKDDVAGYLRHYAAAFDLPVRLATTVTSLTRRGGGGYVAKAGDTVLEARQVVVATGPFQDAVIPPIADSLDPDVLQLHSAHYRNRDSVPTGRVLVVGAANSGCQIAQELSPTHAVELSVGAQIPTIPQRPLGRDVWWWGRTLRLDKVTTGSRLGKRLAGRDQVIGVGPRRLARHHNVRIRPRAAGATGHTVRFADGTAAEYDAVVWATGYTTNHGWIDIPTAIDRNGRLLQDRGVTPSPGLYSLGLPWQHTRGSALLGWVGADAGFIANKIAGG